MTTYKAGASATANLRFVSRDGKMILQQMWGVPSDDGYHHVAEWRDVPVETEVMKPNPSQAVAVAGVETMENRHER